MNNLSRAFVFLCLAILFPFFTQAANPPDVVINEIAWMGTEISHNDEWIELYNNTSFPINLDSWLLKTADGSPKIKLEGEIPANGFYLLERTDDNTLAGIKADLIYSGALKNAGENLKLYDNLGNLIDEVDCSAGWFAGDNKTKQTMERKSGNRSGSDSLNWQTSQNPGGTPKAKNSLIVQEEPRKETDSKTEPQPQPGPEKVAEVKPLQVQVMVYPSGVIINEILPSPDGPDEIEEWIEIFNQNDFEVNLSNWQIADTAGRVTTYTFPKGTKISPKGFLVLSRPTTKITLNNKDDSLKLLQPDGKIIDSVNYERAPQGQSYNRTDLEWVWSTILTPGSVNIIPAPISRLEPSKREISETTPERKGRKGDEREVAVIGETLQQTQDKQISKSFLSLLLVALTIAIFSGIIILILKRKIKGFDSLFETRG